VAGRGGQAKWRQAKWRWWLVSAVRLLVSAASCASAALGVSRTRIKRDAGMATAEYAIATVAAVGFAGLLVIVLRSGEVQALLLGIIRRALSV
jgi:hypothetical protein